MFPNRRTSLRKRSFAKGGGGGETKVQVLDVGKGKFKFLCFVYCRIIKIDLFDLNNCLVRVGVYGKYFRCHSEDLSF